MIVHDHVIDAPLQWVEFDQSQDQFSLVYDDGTTQSLGIDLNKKTKANLIKAEHIELACIADKEKVIIRTYPLIIRDY